MKFVWLGLSPTNNTQLLAGLVCSLLGYCLCLCLSLHDSNARLAAGPAMCRCVDTPCKACKRCLRDFSPFVTSAANMALTDKDQLAAAFSTFCTGTAGRDPSVCQTAQLGVAGSFRGNAARRAGAICSLLLECNAATVAACR